MNGHTETQQDREDRVNLSGKMVRGSTLWTAECPDCGTEYRSRWSNLATVDALDCCKEEELLTDGGAATHRSTFCPNCGEFVDPGMNDEMDTAPCDNCCTTVEPISDSRKAGMPFKCLHPIKCTGCNERVQLVGLHMGEYSDGVIVACDCFSIESVPYELGEPELPDEWEIVHDAEVFPDE